MKEHTYGWYPSAKNVYTERRMGAPNEYQLEALYRMRDSKYYEPPVTPPEDRRSKTPSHDRRPASTMSRVSSKGMSEHSAADTSLPMRIRSAPVHTRYKPPPKLCLPTPMQCWSTHIPETEITVFPPSAPTPAPSSRPISVSKATVTYTPAPEPMTPQPRTPIVYDESGPGGKLEAFKKVIRIKSATVRRETPKRPPRSIKSAGPVRTPVPATYTAQELDSLQPSWPCPATPTFDATTEVPIPATFDRIPSAAPTPVRHHAPSPPVRSPSYRRSPCASPAERPSSYRRSSLRPKAPSPYTMELMQEEDEEDRSGTPDYDAEVKKHGWLMQIKGDPLKLKKVSKRLPYTVKVDEPETERDPPKVYMENLDTFFQNTIPRRPMTFAINKEWISEMIHAKRMEQQKKHGGINYRYKNFSFVY